MGQLESEAVLSHMLLALSMREGAEERRHISMSYGPFISACDASYPGDPPGYTDCTLSTETVSVLLHLSRKISMKVICILFSAFLLFGVLFQCSIEVESFNSTDSFKNTHQFGIITSG